MGVWCDFDRTRRTEKTDAIHASIVAAAQMNSPERRQLLQDVIDA
jgi:hypothetical protein